MEVMKYRQACCLDICIIMCTCLVVERRKRDREREVFSFSLDLSVVHTGLKANTNKKHKQADLRGSPKSGTSTEAADCILLEE